MAQNEYNLGKVLEQCRQSFFPNITTDFCFLSASFSSSRVFVSFMGYSSLAFEFVDCEVY